MTKIATWNVNSVKARIGHVLDYLKQAKPDILLLQELKCVDGDFPRLEIEAMGYGVETVGQKSYNGVAILAKGKIGGAVRRLPGEKSDEQARYIEASVGKWRVASIYLPNGNPAPGDKFTYKLAWLERLYAHVAHLLTEGHRLVLGGDYNVAPTDADVYDPRSWADDALCRPESRAAFRKVLYLGLTDAISALHPQPGIYTYWDYMQNRFPKDEGLRIDHFLLSPEAADRLNAAGVDKGPRAKDKASDHTPVWCEFND
ncbi:MAG TPA: exodeoxyribonuclease III [Alphaproteobacteria bacterium]|nr:exodeoxyribonuclease III [Alphaproteobacteria bacterium]